MKKMHNNTKLFWELRAVKNGNIIEGSLEHGQIKGLLNEMRKLVRNS